MKKVFITFGILLFTFVILLSVGCFVLCKPFPEATKGAAAEALALKMMKAVNKEAWDTTTFVQWSFRGGKHQYFWDKSRDYVEVKWEANKVLLNTKQVTGRVFEDGILTEGEAADKLVQKAWSMFCNDSWWLNAAVKATDPGTVRGIVKDKDGKDQLMVSYESGGVTPGDAYLWQLDENGLPISYRMWVSIIPIPGLKFTWQDWTTLEGGAKIATDHKSKLLNIPITDLKAGQTLEAMGLSVDPFEAL